MVYVCNILDETRVVWWWGVKLLGNLNIGLVSEVVLKVHVASVFEEGFVDCFVVSGFGGRRKFESFGQEVDSRLGYWRG